MYCKCLIVVFNCNIFFVYLKVIKYKLNYYIIIQNIKIMFEKYLKAAKTLLELAKDRGFPIYSTYVNPTLFKQKYELFRRGDETNIDILDYVIRDSYTNKRLLLCFYRDVSFDRKENTPEKTESIQKVLDNMYVRIQNILNEYHITKRDQIMFVYNDEYIESDGNELYELEKNNLRLCGLSKLQFNVSRHIFVPKHERISLFERRRLLKEYKSSERKLPSIQFNDPQVIYHGFSVGSIIKITRNQATSGETSFYRYVDSDIINPYNYAVSEFAESDNLYKEMVNVLDKDGFDDEIKDRLGYIQYLKRNKGTKKLNNMFSKILKPFKINTNAIEKLLKTANKDETIYYELYKSVNQLNNIRSDYYSGTNPDEIIELIKPHEFPTVNTYLDIGCSTGDKTIAIGQFLKAKQIHGADLNCFDGPIERKEGFHFQEIKKDGKLPYDDNTFDVISLLHTLHHMEDKDSILSEIKRVLKPEGVFILREHDLKSEFDKKLVDVEHFVYMLSIKQRFSLASLEGYKSFYMTRKETQELLDTHGFSPGEIYKVKSGNYNKSYIEIYKGKEAEEEVEQSEKEEVEQSEKEEVEQSEKEEVEQSEKEEEEEEGEPVKADLKKTEEKEEKKEKEEKEAEEEDVAEAEEEDVKEQVRAILSSLKGDINNLNMKDFRKMYQEKYTNGEKISKELKAKIKTHLEELFEEEAEEKVEKKPTKKSEKKPKKKTEKKKPKKKAKKAEAVCKVNVKTDRCSKTGTERPEDCEVSEKGSCKKKKKK
jgi:DNA-directed RNA polymerase subunit H